MEQKNTPANYLPQEETRFLEYMRAIEGEAPQTTLMALITRDGVQVPSPDELNDDSFPQIVGVIHAIHNHGALLYSTDHLSDRELYRKLYEETLTEEYPIVPEGFPHACCIDLLGFGGDEKDDQAHLKYYANGRLGRTGPGNSMSHCPERTARPHPPATNHCHADPGLEPTGVK